MADSTRTPLHRRIARFQPGRGRAPNRSLGMVTMAVAAALVLLTVRHGTAAASCDQPSASSVVVRSGETLRDIARTYYGTESCAGLIAQANSIDDPNEVYTGQVLVLTPAPSDARVRYSYGINPAPHASTPTPTPKPSPSPIATAMTTAPLFAAPVLSTTAATSTNGFIWPLVGPLTQPFGVPELGVGSPHTGIDIGEPSGTPIQAAQEGRVTFAGGDPCCSLGYWIEINHGNRYATRYGHLMRPPLFLVGDYVRQGQIIGFSGNTGFSTGPHLHFEIRLDGAPIDPMRLLP